MQEIAFVFGIHSFFIFSTITLIIVEHYEQKLKTIKTQFLMSPIKQEIIYKTFEAKVYKASTKISIYDLEASTVRRIHKQLALQLLTKVEECIDYTHIPPHNKPYEEITATLIVGENQCNP